ncbi:trna (5-methylaminomethyl-2-thiouridylate)-methyltransferase [Moniliophthora roreri]|nr:trna (5-methylaminomethyl-2-thiouridylate)-methyltransferase [Moniliophthora roreri]
MAMVAIDDKQKSVGCFGQGGKVNCARTTERPGCFFSPNSTSQPVISLDSLEQRRCILPHWEDR